MSLRLIGRHSQSFIRPAFCDHEMQIAQMAGTINGVGDTLNYSNSDVPLSIVKPWGVETLIGMSPTIEIWELTIQPTCSTSYHCHIRKDTLLVIAQGEALLRTERQTEHLRTGDFRFLAKRAFHQTSCLGDAPLVLYEIEAPPDKNDLVRIQDKYQRSGKSYLFGSRVANRERLSQMVLSQPSKILGYLEKQRTEHLLECEKPIVVTPHRGLARTVCEFVDSENDGNYKRVRVRETLIPCHDGNNRSGYSPNGNYSQFLRDLAGPSDDAHVSLPSPPPAESHDDAGCWILVMLSGELSLMEFKTQYSGELGYLQDPESDQQQTNVGSIDRNARDSVQRLGPGDVLIRDAGSSLTVLRARDVLALTFHSQ